MGNGTFPRERMERGSGTIAARLTGSQPDTRFMFLPSNIRRQEHARPPRQQILGNWAAMVVSRDGLSRLLAGGDIRGKPSSAPDG